MDRAALEQFLQEAGSLLHRGEQSIAHQREVIETLARGGHYATAAKMFLTRLESAHARYIADRNRLFKELADDPREIQSIGPRPKRENGRPSPHLSPTDQHA